MRKLVNGIWKELILLTRDKAGLGILFVMPATLVVIITLVQDSTFQLMQDNRIPVVIVDEDREPVARQLIQEVSSLGEFNIHQDTTLNLAQLEDAIQKGQYKVGIFIPTGFSNELKQHGSAKSALLLAAMEGESALPTDSIRNAPIALIFDPVMKLSFRTAVKNGLETILARIETREMLESVFLEINGSELPESVVEVLETPPNYFSESIQDNDGKTKIPTSTQHNVPAWTLFAMFFIVIALGGNIVYEKEQGSFMRLRTLPVSFMNILLSKVLTYMLVCFVQLFIIVAIGMWLFPYMGLPAFELPNQMGLFLLFTLLIALSATSYGMLVGTLARTHQQAGSFGAISVMILAAIGGVWVPTFAMPEILQQLSVISPLNWGLESYYGLFIRESSFSDLYIYALLFVVFAAGCFALTFSSLRKQGII